MFTKMHGLIKKSVSMKILVILVLHLKLFGLGDKLEVHTSVQHPFAKAIMNELHGSAVVGGHSRRNGGKYKVIYNG